MLNTTVDTLIFDLDNTLIDRNLAMRLTIGDWLQSQGSNAMQQQTALDVIMQHDDWGYTDRMEFCGWLLKTYGNDQSRKGSPQDLLSILLQNISSHVQPDPSIRTMLQAAGSSFKLVLATNGGSITQRAKIRQAQLGSFFGPEAVFVSGEMGFEKPDPRFFKKIIEVLQLDPTRTMSVGDNLLNDIKPARQSGLLTCWVSYGRPDVNIVGPDRTIINTTEIATWRR